MISVLILTKNEEQMIKTCLESVKWADEIILVDNNSKDKTVEIAQKFTEKIFQKDFEGYDEERNFLLRQAQNEWILYVDADERVSAQLKEEIRGAISNQSLEVSAFAIPRKNILLGKWQKHGGWWPDYQTRLFKRKALKGWRGELHETPVFEGTLGHLKNPLIHLTHRDIISMMKKTIQWAPVEAKLRFEANHPKMSWWRFVRIVRFEAILRFLKGGWRDGIEGIIEIYYQVFSLFITYVKLWEMQRKEKLEDTYKKIDEELLKNNFKI